MALTDMQTLTTNVDRLVFFGAPFHSGNGVHDVHQNQGDPPPPPPSRQKHFDDSGIWQDGISIAIKTDGTAVAFLNRFGTQSSQTDSNGHPI